MLERSAPKATPCSCCASPAETEVWGKQVCYPCAGDWHERAPTAGDVAKKYPQASHEERCAVWARWTDNWATKRKAELAKVAA